MQSHTKRVLIVLVVRVAEKQIEISLHKTMCRRGFRNYDSFSSTLVTHQFYARDVWLIRFYVNGLLMFGLDSDTMETLP